MQKQKRKQLRLGCFHYSSAGYYFITVCTYHRQALFGEICNGVVSLTEIGGIVNRCIELISVLHEETSIPCHIVMPDHIHFILMIDHSTDVESTNRTKMLVPKIIQLFKSAVSKHVVSGNCDCPTPIWQKSYYDRIIRNEHEFNQICKYIRRNPQNTKSDQSPL